MPMRYAVRRLISLGSTLLLVSLLTFWALTTHSPGGSQLPQFVNWGPRDVRDFTQRALQGLSQADDASIDDELLSMGGAALPYLLPLMESLPPDRREVVGQALMPLASRMGLEPGVGSKEPFQAIVFWSRFWRQHAVDYQPAKVRRLVQQLINRPLTLRVRDLLIMDTFALQELMRTLETRQLDRDGLRRITALAAHVTGHDWKIVASTSDSNVNAIRAQWRRWWRHERAHYLAFGKVERLSAMLSETRYARWLSATVTEPLRSPATGSPLLPNLRSGLTTTALLLAAALLGTYVGSRLCEGTLLFRRRRQRTAIGLLFAGLVVIPPSIPAAWLKHSHSAVLRMAYAMLLLAAFGLMVSFLRQHALGKSTGAREVSAPPLAVGRIRRGLAVVQGLFATRDYPWLITIVILVETRLGLSGLGVATIDAIKVNDIASVMLFALFSATLSWALQCLSANSASPLPDGKSPIGGTNQ